MRGERYVVVGLFEAMDVGAVFSRASWPAHVTLVSNVVTSEPVDAISRALRSGGVPSAPVTIEFRMDG